MNNQRGGAKACKHRNIWLICGGAFCWCYECGAVRPNAMGKKKIYWQPPSYSKENPAVSGWYPAKTWDYAEVAQ